MKKNLHIILGLFFLSAFVALGFANCSPSGGGAAAGGSPAAPGGNPSSPSQIIAVANAITYSGILFDKPRALAVDGAGVVWVADGNASGKGVIRIDVSATPSCASGCSAITAVSGNLAGLAIDGGGNVWLKNGLVKKISNSGSILSGAFGYGSGYNFYGDYAIAIDSAGSAWFGNSSPSVANMGVVANSGSVISGGYAGGLSFISSVAVDGNDNVWVANTFGTGGGSVVKFPAGSPSAPVTYLSSLIVTPSSIAVDPSGNVWIANNNPPNPDSVVEIKLGAPANCATLCVKYSGNFLKYARAVAADGAGNIWVGNGVNGSVTKIIPGAAADCTTGCTQYTYAGLSNVSDVALDSSGNVWLADQDGARVVKFPAIAAATTTPISLQSRGAALGTFWAPQTSNLSNLQALTFAAGQYVAVGAGQIATSPDTIKWTARNSGTTEVLKAVTYGSSKFVAVGANGSIVTSLDGISWTPRASGTASNLSAIAWSGTQFLALGSNSVLSSADGVTWSAKPAAPSANYNSVAWSGTKFVAVATSQIDSTTDGTTWTSATGVLSAAYVSSSCSINGIATSGSRMIAVGGNSTGTHFILTSTDAGSLTWSEVTKPTFSLPIGLLSVTWSGNQFVTVGYNGNIATSPDGLSWTPRNSGINGSLSSVAGNNSSLVTASNSGNILSSK